MKIPHASDRRRRAKWRVFPGRRPRGAIFHPAVTLLRRVRGRRRQRSLSSSVTFGASTGGSFGSSPGPAGGNAPITGARRRCEACGRASRSRPTAGGSAASGSSRCPEDHRGHVDRQERVVGARSGGAIGRKSTATLHARLVGVVGVHARPPIPRDRLASRPLPCGRSRARSRQLWYIAFTSRLRERAVRQDAGEPDEVTYAGRFEVLALGQGGSSVNRAWSRST